MDDGSEDRVEKTLCLKSSAHMEKGTKRDRKMIGNQTVSFTLSRNIF